MVKTESYKENLLESFLDDGAGCNIFGNTVMNKSCAPWGGVSRCGGVPRRPSGLRARRSSKELPHLRRIYYARIPFTTLPAMPVNRASRPWNFTVRRLWSMPSRCNIVAWKSGTATAFSTAA